MRTSHRLSPAVLTAALLLLASACTAGSEGSAASSPSSGATTSASASPTPSASAPAVPRAPKRRACYRLTSAQLTRPTNHSRPVPCTAQHTSRTIFVGRLHTVVSGHSIAVDSSAVQRQVSTTCPRKLAGYVGGTPVTLHLSRVNVVWFSPTLAQSDRGADWFRCDLVAFSRGDQLSGLPRTGPGLKGALDRRGALDTYGLCGTAAPGASGFVRVACALPHSWRAIETVGLAGGRSYPGDQTVRVGGSGRCRDIARSRSGGSLRFRYGWEWPTRDQWTGGQHYGYCWVPA